jgi:hypothetical protein
LEKGDLQRAAYRAAEFAGTLYGIPVVTAYDRILRYLEDWSDGDLDADIRENFGHIRDKNK